MVASSIIYKYAPFDNVIIPGPERYEQYRPDSQGGENDEDQNRFTGKDPLRSAGIKWQSHPIPPLQDRQNGVEAVRVAPGRNSVRFIMSLYRLLALYTIIDNHFKHGYAEQGEEGVKV